MAQFQFLKYFVIDRLEHNNKFGEFQPVAAKLLELESIKLILNLLSLYFQPHEMVQSSKNTICNKLGAKLLMFKMLDLK